MTVLLQPDIVSQELFMSALVKVALKVPALKVWFTSKRYYLGCLTDLAVFVITFGCLCVHNTADREPLLKNID